MSEFGRERLFDDFKLGDCFKSDGMTMTEAAILDFAQRFDPQPFHLDIEAAKTSPYGGLIASGLHTFAVGFRLFLDTRIVHSASMGSPGVDELRWTQPVRPGDTLVTEAEVMEMRPSASKPDRGTLRMRYEVKNQKGEAVMSFTAIHILRRKL
ncbi:MAG: MaoC family dehydratase [Proteobacteria bacterium]|nr:MaoC family dehydratase [Pseudomonadota bacterium]